MKATLHTNHGDIIITLFPDHAPKTVANFVGLADGREGVDRPAHRREAHQAVLRRPDLPPDHPRLHDPGRLPARQRHRRPGLHVRRRDQPRQGLQQALPARHGQRRQAQGKGTNGSQFFITVGPDPVAAGQAHDLRRGRRRPEPRGRRRDRRRADRRHDKPRDAVVIESRHRRGAEQDHARPGPGQDDREWDADDRARMAEQLAPGLPAAPRPGGLRPLPALRAGRSVPECQRPAAVGVQCVDCVREQASRAMRTGRAPSSAARSTDGRPVVTLTIIGDLRGGLPRSSRSRAGGDTRTWRSRRTGADAEPWRFLTAAFLHSPRQPLHIAVQHVRAVAWSAPYLEPLLGRAALRRALPGQRARRLGRLPAAGHPDPAASPTCAGQLVVHRRGRRLGRGVRPVRGAARAQPARSAGRSAGMSSMHRHQRRARVRHPRHRLAGPPRRAAHRCGRRRGAHRRRPRPRRGASGCSWLGWPPWPLVLVVLARRSTPSATRP